MQTELDFAVKVIKGAFEEAKLLSAVKIVTNLNKFEITIKFHKRTSLNSEPLQNDREKSTAGGKSMLKSSLPSSISLEDSKTSS